MITLRGSTVMPLTGIQVHFVARRLDQLVADRVQPPDRLVVAPRRIDQRQRASSGMIHMSACIQPGTSG